MSHKAKAELLIDFLCKEFISALEAGELDDMLSSGRAQLEQYISYKEGVVHCFITNYPKVNPRQT
jgi:hypothetical protein